MSLSTQQYTTGYTVILLTTRAGRDSVCSGTRGSVLLDPRPARRPGPSRARSATARRRATQYNCRGEETPAARYSWTPRRPRRPASSHRPPPPPRWGQELHIGRASPIKIVRAARAAADGEARIEEGVEESKSTEPPVGLRLDNCTVSRAAERLLIELATDLAAAPDADPAERCRAYLNKHYPPAPSAS